MNDFDRAREALTATLKNQGRGPDYIEDFLSHYDQNLKNVDDWHLAAKALKAWETVRADRPSGETVSLRADEHGKPSFHLSLKAMTWLLDTDPLPHLHIPAPPPSLTE